MLTCTVHVVVHRPPQYKLRHHEGDLKQATYVTWQKGAIDRMYVDGQAPCRPSRAFADLEFDLGLDRHLQGRRCQEPAFVPCG